MSPWGPQGYGMFDFPPTHTPGVRGGLLAHCFGPLAAWDGYLAALMVRSNFLAFFCENLARFECEKGSVEWRSH